MSTRRLEKHPSLESLVERVDSQRPGEITGDTVPTGFASVDKMLGGGLRRRDLVVLGGDIGSGKSALALGVALRVAQQGIGVALLSGEMDQARAGIGAAAVRLRGLPLAILPVAADDLETMAARLEPLRQLGLVVVDYLQLVLRRLKALALERQVALLVVAQLPRFDGKRQDPRPTLDDFGHLGAVKQHADVALALFREE